MAMKRILVANRGEIARRVFRTARAMGIETVAVYSEPDADAPFIREADISIPLRGATSAETYLDVEQIVDAVRRSGADAVHPGYGFLSENAGFAEAMGAAGVTWIGPTPESIRAMALKVEAKRLASSAGVPLVPGAELGDGVDAAEVAAEVGYPLLVKASAGGGGKGMRIVERPEDLDDALESARREAQASFGDPTVFLERYLTESRHVEVQVFGDTHGDVVHLGERECSIQRRHQKVVEESPSPGLAPHLAEPMYAAAVSLASSIGYVGAGTV
ncbi:MAG: biotin carboxylase N-terminal domain-containing protein, partial [Candidatus Nanopelagicales bacterium]